jgi:F-type H+-transporting ATPase subunit b
MGLLTPHTGTVIWMFIAFLMVFLLLKKFAWRPLLNALKLREGTIADALRSAENAREEMQKLRVSNEKIIAEAKRERDKIILESKDLKESILNQAKEQASLEAKKIIENARTSIESEKESALKEIKDHAAYLSISIAEKLLREKLVSDEEQKELINKLLRDTRMN